MVKAKNKERIAIIVDHLLKHGRVSVQDMSNRLNVSPMTIRRDLNYLEKQGIVQRVYGGALIIEGALEEFSYQKKLAFEVDEKRIIGRVTAELIAEGDTVFLDKGTTVAEVARAMHDKKDLTVITNSLAVAEELKSQHFIDLVIIGGILERSLMGMAGPLALEGIRKFRFDKAVLGIGGLSVKHGLTTRDIAEAEIKRAVIGASQSVMVPATGSKLETVKLVSIAPLSAIDVVIAGALEEETLRGIEGEGVRVVQAYKVQREE